MARRWARRTPSASGAGDATASFVQCRPGGTRRRRRSHVDVPATIGTLDLEPRCAGASGAVGRAVRRSVSGVRSQPLVGRCLRCHGRTAGRTVGLWHAGVASCACAGRSGSGAPPGRLAQSCARRVASHRRQAACRSAGRPWRYCQGVRCGSRGRGARSPRRAGLHGRSRRRSAHARRQCDGASMADRHRGTRCHAAAGALGRSAQWRAMATSGDYRNYFFEDGQRYSHEIDPPRGTDPPQSVLRHGRGRRLHACRRAGDRADRAGRRTGAGRSPNAPASPPSSSSALPGRAFQGIP